MLLFAHLRAALANAYHSDHPVRRQTTWRTRQGRLRRIGVWSLVLGPAFFSTNSSITIQFVVTTLPLVSSIVSKFQDETHVYCSDRPQSVVICMVQTSSVIQKYCSCHPVNRMAFNPPNLLSKQGTSTGTIILVAYTGSVQVKNTPMKVSIYQNKAPFPPILQPRPQRRGGWEARESESPRTRCQPSPMIFSSKHSPQIFQPPV